MNAYATIFNWLSFGFCFSATAGGMLMLFRRSQTELGAAFAFFQYYFILITLFGYYSLWSWHILGVFAQFEGAEYVAEIVNALGIPFFLSAVLMLLMWGCRLSQRSPLIVLPSVALVVALIDIVMSVLGFDAFTDLNGIWALAGIVATVAFAFLLLSSKGEVLGTREVKLMLGILAALTLVYASRLSSLSGMIAYQTVFNILYFALHSALVVLYVTYAPSVQKYTGDSFAERLQQYGISKREMDVIEGIYAGKTNQEIANSLFITLQTVKDHTSRIYQKTFVKNRGQLVALLRAG